MPEHDAEEVDRRAEEALSRLREGRAVAPPSRAGSALRSWWEDARPPHRVAAVATAVLVALVLAVAALAWTVGPRSQGGGGAFAPVLTTLTTLPSVEGGADREGELGGGTVVVPGTAPAGGEIVVHAAGAVASPGLRHLPAGSRVADLLAAAGGPAPDADLDRLNLATPLTDGQRLFVPRIGQDAPAVAGPDGGPAGSGSPGGGGGPGSPVDLNSATEEELDALPGVGPATAGAIVAHRERNGAFRAVDDLLEVRGIGPAKLEALRDLVTVGVSAGLAPWRRGPLTDGALVAVAASAAAGAWWAAPVPVALGAAAVVGALASGRALLVAVGVAVLAAGLSHQAHAGLAPPPPGPFRGEATLVSDPEPAFGAWRADVRTSEGRLELEARGGAGGRLSTVQAGERIVVVGRIGPVRDPAWTTPRHVRGRLVAETVEHAGDGGPLARFVNGLRSLVTDGARSIPEGPRALFTGFVLGDDRGGSVVVADDFEASGLSHLLVVSGQNVAFALAVAAPLLARVGRRARLAATLALLVVFALVTRLEPSVLRATAMAGVAAVAVALGRPATGTRVLALAVTGLLLVDPLLVLSTGFRLSVAASAGIIVVGRRLAAALPGPSWFRAALAVTLAAQVAVAPLLVPAFGPMPVAAVPANLLAEPVAGLVMMWGCTAGLAAGVVPAPVAAVLHLPTRLGLWWVAGVARVMGAAPLGTVGLLGVGVVAVAALALVHLGAPADRRADGDDRLPGGDGRRARRIRRGRRAALSVIAAVALLAAVRSPAVVPGEVDVGGAVLWTGSGPTPGRVLVLPGDARPAGVLKDLRHLGVGHLDLVVVRSPGPGAARALQVLRQRVVVDQVWVPAGAAASGSPPPSTPVSGGGLEVSVRGRADGLDVDVAVVPDGAPVPGSGVGPGG